MPITTNAFQSTTDGSDFYLAVFDNNAQSILYATYFGGNQSSEHVDGGTSRFDKNGKIYQAVCAGCFNNSDFPTSPGAYSSVNNNSCNLGVFKFTFESIIPSISIPQSFVCLPNSFQFTNQSEGGNLYSWDFGDGLTSNLFSPSHNYADTGIYDVTLIVSDSMSCIDSDTAILQVQVYALNNASITGNHTICLGDSTLLTGYGGTDYSWFPSTFLNNSYTQQVYANPASNIDYTLIATDSCGVDTAYFNVNVPYPIVDAGTDFSMNLGESKTLNGFTNTNNYLWESSSWLSCFNCLNPQINPIQTTLYILNVTDSSGCINSDTVEVTIRGSIFVPNTFTPNGDLKNDEFKIIGENIKSFELWIYNRWGEEIYHATEINNFWDGRYLGNKCKIDSYIWVIEYFDLDNTFKSIKGHINLLK
jgi:gliding motility-associated-like protein